MALLGRETAADEEKLVMGGRKVMMWGRMGKNVLKKNEKGEEGEQGNPASR